MTGRLPDALDLLAEPHARRRDAFTENPHVD